MMEMIDSTIQRFNDSTSLRLIPILVVDDSRDNLDLMEALLVSEGFENVHLALSGQEALDVLRRHGDIGLVLLDMMMPGMDGHEVCRRMAKSAEWRHIPVIIVTGGALRRNEALEKSFAAGAIDFISKPINEVELFSRIHSALTLFQERVMRREKTRQLAESEEKFRITFDQAPVGIAHVDRDGRILLANRRLSEMLGYQREELLRLVFGELQEGGDVIPHQEQLRILEETGDVLRHFDLQLRHKKRHTVWTHVTVSALREPGGNLKYFIYVLEDITEQKRIEESLRLAATVFDSSTEAIIITDASANILRVNRAFTEITGYRQDEVLGKNPRLLSSGVHDPSFFAGMWASLERTGQWQGEIINRRKTGEVYPSWLTLCAVKDAEGQTRNYVGISVDITVRKETEERLSFLANHDALTGLPNRLLFNDRLQHALARANRERFEMAVLFFDLDRFKNINDTLGHDVGDILLQQVSRRLSGCIRKSDTLARWGGDEFILLLERIRSGQDAALVARRILDLLQEPFKVEGHDVFVTCSIGISVFPRDGEDGPTLLRNADTAMYYAKEKGKDNYKFYRAEMNASARERFQLESDLRRALVRQEFLLHYQPRVDLKTRRIVGVEALARWQHPVRGLICPKYFIPLAEETGLIVPLGEWVLRTACLQGRKWLDEHPRGMALAVNLSGCQLSKLSLSESVERVLKETEMDPEMLELEITESVMMQDYDTAVRVLDRLTKTGVRIALDDFGTGYSSLGYLKRLPIGILKIHQSLIHDVPEDTKNVAITRAIIALGHGLNLRVVAEGVETEKQLAFLVENGCDEGQGHLFGKAMPVEELEKLLA